MPPDQHPAYVAFMAQWDSPPDLSDGSRAGFDDQEMAVLNAALVFRKANPPPVVRDLLVEWLRPRMARGGPWNCAAGALRVICETESSPEVIELGRLLDQESCSRETWVAHLNALAGRPVEVRDALATRVDRHPRWFMQFREALRAYVDGAPLP